MPLRRPNRYTVVRLLANITLLPALPLTAANECRFQNS